MALINNKTPTITGVGIAGPGSSVQLITMLPGINEIDNESFQKIKTHPHFMQRVKDKTIEILSDVQQADNKKTVDEMLGYMPRILDTKLLKKIIKEDGRQAVIQAAKDQLEIILNPDSKKDSNNEHFQ